MALIPCLIGCHLRKDLVIFLFVPFSTAAFAVGFGHGYFQKKVKMVDKNERSKQDEEEEGQMKIMMRRARGHFDKARVNRYSSITFWSFYLHR